MEYIRDEFRYMRLTLGTCNIRASTAAREHAPRYPGRRNPDADAFRRLEQRLVEIELSHPRHTWIQVTLGCRVTSRWRGHSCSCETKTLEKLVRYRKRIWRIPPRLLEVLQEDQFHPYNCSRGAHLFPHDRPLRMQLCEWLWHQHTADEL
jgi:hypothetical protein